MVQLKLVVTYYQILAAAASVYVAEMPDEYYQFVPFLETVWFRPPPPYMIPNECYSSELLWLIAASCWPLAVMLVAVTVAQVFALKESRRAVVHRQLLHFCLVLLFCVVPPVSATVLGTFRCKSMAVDDNSEGQVHRFLTSNMRIRCPDDSGISTPEYYRIRAFAYLMTVVWPCGMPVLFLVLAMRDNKAAASSQRVSDFLTKDYRPEFYWVKLELWSQTSPSASHDV